MSGMTLLEGHLQGTHLNGIRFSAFSTLHAPTAQVYGDSAFLEARPFQTTPANILEFIYRTCTKTKRFRSATRWGDCMLSVDAFGFEFAVPKIEGNSTDQMSFRLQTIYGTDDENSNTFLRAELEYKSPAFYLFQFAEYPLATSEWDITIKNGIAATLIAGGTDLFRHVANQYGLNINGTNLTLNDATTIASRAAHHNMTLNPSSFIYESGSRGYGYSCHESTVDDAADLSVKFSADDISISTLHGHVLKGPSIAILQNMPISAYGMHGNVEPIVRDLVHAAATMCPTLPMARSL